MNNMNNEDYGKLIEFNDICLSNKDLFYPKITIVTPSYNQGRFLERTILSVLNQNYPNLEYIIIDGGSEDNSVDIIKKHENYLHYWVSEPDKGQSDAINKGFLLSSGEILAWINSDDTYLPGAFQTVANLFNSKKADMIYGRCYLVDEHDYAFSEAKVTPFNFTDYMLGFFTIPQPSAFWRREIFFNAGMLNVSNYTCMDYELWLKFAMQGARITYYDAPLANFRLHVESISGSGRYSFDYIQDMQRITKSYLGYIPKKTYVNLRKVLFHLKHLKTLFRYYLKFRKNGTFVQDYKELI